MTDQQTGNRQWLTRGVFLSVCLVAAILLVAIWVTLASKMIEVDVAAPQSANEHGAATSEAQTTGQGNWYVSLASFRLQKDAEAMVNQLKEKGVKADSVAFIGAQKNYVYHRVRVSGFASEEEAQKELVVLSNRLGIRNAWVGRDP